MTFPGLIILHRRTRTCFKNQTKTNQTGFNLKGRSRLTIEPKLRLLLKVQFCFAMEIKILIILQEPIGRKPRPFILTLNLPFDRQGDCVPKSFIVKNVKMTQNIIWYSSNEAGLTKTGKVYAIYLSFLTYRRKLEWILNSFTNYLPI